MAIFKLFALKGNQSLADIHVAEHICQIKKGSDVNFFLKRANELFFVSDHSNFKLSMKIVVLKQIGFRRLSHSSEMQNDALMHREGLMG